MMYQYNTGLCFAGMSAPNLSKKILFGLYGNLDAKCVGESRQGLEREPFRIVYRGLLKFRSVGEARVSQPKEAFSFEEKTKQQ